MFDFNRCVICQLDTGQSLLCPANSNTGTCTNAGYITLAQDLSAFLHLNSLPSHLVEFTNPEFLVQNVAKWHKSCRAKYDKTKLERLRRKIERIQCDESLPSVSNPLQTRSSVGCKPKVGEKRSLCFFCDEPASKLSRLSEAQTKDIDVNVRNAATYLQDTRLLAKLSEGDMVALEAKYHPNCLRALYNKARPNDPPSQGQGQCVIEGIAFAELIAFIEQSRSESVQLFKLSELTSLYQDRLDQLGIGSKYVHSSRLKDRLQDALPSLQAIPKGREVLLSFRDDIAEVLISSSHADHEGITLMRAAQQIRKEIFAHSYKFNGSFSGDLQDSVPSGLLSFVRMLLDGPNITSSATMKPAVSTISQLIVFNTVKHARKSDSAVRHCKEREPPLPIYVALKIHGSVRSRGLVDALFQQGICISYPRLMEIMNSIGHAACEKFVSDGVVCPHNLNSNVFTTAAVDNIDHNPSSVTSVDSFHGTALSLMQHLTSDNQGSVRPPLLVTDIPSAKAPQLPSSYCSVPPLALAKKDFLVPTYGGNCGQVFDDDDDVPQSQLSESQWLEFVNRALQGQGSVEENTEWISWAAYHASMLTKEPPLPAKTALLPLFFEKAHSAAMMHHSMHLVKAATEHLNPGQVPVLVADQPLFALCKQLQWTFPETFGEDKFVMMFGGLHIEMAMQKLLGNWLDQSGWTSALSMAEIASPGSAESFIHGCSVGKTRHAHEVTAAALFCLQKQAYEESGTTMAFEDWCCKQQEESMQFKFWHMTLKLQNLALTYVRAIRIGDFESYKKTLLQVLPWFFSMDHTHYARWLTVHLKDMLSLPDLHPSLLAQFKEGKFVVNKNGKAFSSIALDHCHEQHNAVIKGSGGAVGLTENPAALHRWVVTGPEIGRLVTEFEDNERQGNKLHHDQQPSTQNTFRAHVAALTKVLSQLGNPFSGSGPDLYNIDTKEIMSAGVCHTVKSIESIGRDQFQDFFQQRLASENPTPITDIIPKNKLPLFSSPSSNSAKDKKKSQLHMLKRDCGLFSRLYVACQSREGKLEDFFRHENQPEPPSLSHGGQLRLGKKSDIVSCVISEECCHSVCPEVDAIVLDGAAIVHMLQPGTSKTFDEYVNNIFLPYIKSCLIKSRRTDVVFDVYSDDSLKNSTRAKRGEGKRRKVLPNSVLPKKWKDFLCVSENKTELFLFIAQHVAAMDLEEGKVVYVTSGTEVLQSRNADPMNPSTHEEADARILLHVHHAVQSGHKRVMIRTVDSDVVVISLAMFMRIMPEELWIVYGVKPKAQNLAIHEAVHQIGATRSASLPFFHAFTGCDTASSFSGKGKKSAWNLWQIFPEVSSSFMACSQLDQQRAIISDTAITDIERFTILLYDQTSGCSDINKAREEIFTRSPVKSLELIPPTKAALVQHIRRAALQAHIWNQAITASPILPDPSQWGWQKTEASWSPLWTTLPEASEACYELIRCGCKTSCSARCKCKKAALKCTALCACGGGCMPFV